MTNHPKNFNTNCPGELRIAYKHKNDTNGYMSLLYNPFSYVFGL